MISIVVPCYNCEKTIDNTVKYLREQTESNLEIILVNDGSTDSTPDLCNSYAGEDSRIKVVHQENKGLMRAWKNGVIASNGEYIVFCDADDYLDLDLVNRLHKTIDKYPVDLILYGMYEEYENGNKVKDLNRLPQGFYNREKIEQDIFPNLLSDGSMQSEMISKSRCNKAFKKQLLESIMDDLPDHISFSEDDLTTFTSVLNANNIYCMGDYCPYHYLRNAESMIGKHDPEIFSKIDMVYKEIRRVAKKYGYTYDDQIMRDQFSTVMLFMKKEICRNPGGRKITVKALKDVRDSRFFDNSFKGFYIDNYEFASKAFATLIVKRWFTLAYFMVKVFEMIRGRNT